jgi:hypothetical protein
MENDFYNFWENYLKPKDNITLNNNQKKLVKYIETYHNVIVLKFRQVGCSLCLKAYVAYLLTYFRGMNIGVITTSSWIASDYLRDIKSMIDTLPNDLHPGYYKCTDSEIGFKNNSTIVVGTTNKISEMRHCKPITFLIMEEIGYIPNIENVWSALAPSLHTFQRFQKDKGLPYGCVITSTEARGDLFKDMWDDASKENATFKQIEMGNKEGDI